MSMSEIVIYIENIIKSFHKHTVTILTSPTVIQVSCPDISSSKLRCDKFIFNSAPVCDNIVELQTDDKCTGEESSEFVGDNFTNAALDLVLPDVSNQPSDDVDDAIIDELNENDVSSNSICNHISLTLDCVYSLHVFLHENSKLQSLSDKQLVDTLQNSDVLYTNSTLEDLKRIIIVSLTLYPKYLLFLVDLNCL